MKPESRPRKHFNKYDGACSRGVIRYLLDLFPTPYNSIGEKGIKTMRMDHLDGNMMLISLHYESKGDTVESASFEMPLPTEKGNQLFLQTNLTPYSHGTFIGQLWLMRYELPEWFREAHSDLLELRSLSL